MTDKMHSLHLRTTPAPLGGSGHATGVGVGGLTSTLIGNPTLISSTLSAQLRQDALQLTPVVDIDVEHPPSSAISTSSASSMFPVPVLSTTSMSSSMIENVSNEQQCGSVGGGVGGGAGARTITTAAQMNFQMLPLMEQNNGGQSAVDTHFMGHEIGTPVAAMSNSQISSMMSNESLLATASAGSATGPATAGKPIIAQSVAGGVSIIYFILL